MKRNIFICITLLVLVLFACKDPEITDPDLPIVGIDSTLNKDPKPDLLLHLALNDGAGSTAVDSSGKGNNGTIMNEASWVSGWVEGALKLNGVNQYINIPDFSFTPKAYTISFFIKPDSLADLNQWIGAGASWGRFAFHTTSKGEVFMGTSEDSRMTASDLPAGTISAKIWQHIAFTFDNGRASFYKNGTLRATMEGMALPDTWNDFQIGKDDANTINGQIDDIRIYNRALSSAEVQTLADQEGTMPKPILNPPNPFDMPQPLKGFTETDAKGDSKDFAMGFYRDDSEPLINGANIKSFVLKKGYMLSIGVTDGFLQPDEIHQVLNGYKFKDKLYKFLDGNLYIANKEDLLINLGPRFAGKVNWMRVAKFIVPDKKGMCLDAWDPGHREILDPGWYYHWKLATWSPDPVSEREFVPMLALKQYISDDNNFWENMLFSGNAKYNEVSTMLGFNEPDLRVNGGTKMTLEEVIGAWPLIMQTGTRLGSPSCIEGSTKPNMLADIMSEFKKRNYRVDFIGAHWYDFEGTYDGNSNNDSAEEVFERFTAKLTGIYETYNLPIWITEFAINHASKDLQLNLDFLALAIPWMESTPWIERYAWYDAGVAEMFSGDKILSPFGQAFKNYNTTPSYIENYSVGTDEDFSFMEF